MYVLCVVYVLTHSTLHMVNILDEVHSYHDNHDETVLEDGKG